MRFGMIILAGGVGMRMGQPIPKQFVLLGGKPIITHVLDRVREFEDVEKVIACPQAHIAQMQELLDHRGFADDFTCVVGGETRQESVYAGLLHLDGCDSVIIHEAVRPFATTEEYRQLIDVADANAIYGVNIPFTVVMGHEFVEGELDRSSLVNVQLPQKFDAANLRAAHEKARVEGLVFTEDASMFHHYGFGPVRVLAGDPRNIKITEPIDLVMGEAIYGESVLGRVQD